MTQAVDGGWEVRFAGSLAGVYQLQMTASGSGLTGGSSPSVSVSTLSLGGDAGNVVGVPDIGIYLAVNVLKFIELSDRQAVVGDGDATQQAESYGIEKAKRGGAVRQDETFTVLSEPPAFAGVREATQELEAETVVDQRDVVLPSELD